MPVDKIDIEAMSRGDCELIPDSVSDNDLYDEMNARTCKSGLTNRQGECCRGTGKIFVSSSFGETKYNLWPRDKAGNLI